MAPEWGEAALAFYAWHEVRYGLLTSARTKDQRFSGSTRWQHSIGSLLQAPPAQSLLGQLSKVLPAAAARRPCPTPQHSPPLCSPATAGLWSAQGNTCAAVLYQGCERPRSLGPSLTMLVLTGISHLNSHTIMLKLEFICSGIFYTYEKTKLGNEFKVAGKTNSTVIFHFLRKETRLSSNHTHTPFASMTCWGTLKSKENGFRTPSCHVPWCPIE